MLPAHIHYPPDLPVSQRREEIVAALRAHPVVIIAGETGSGKTTQLPKMCLEAGLAERGRIGCTQPRRVAAMSVSRRVAEELGVGWGAEVGCKVRFNDDTGRQTRIKFMTDGILLAEIQSDPLLRAYSTLIIDEAHERSLNIDFLLGYLQGLLEKRKDLKILITSATIDTAAFSAAFGGAPIIEVSGRLFPVEIRHSAEEAAEEEGGTVERTVRAVEDALIETDEGDLLVFLPTERDIREAREALEALLPAATHEILPLFGRLPAGEQQRIFAPGGKRRVVLATNVAETSLTIPRIRVVIDTGLARISRYNPRTRTRRLPVEPVSQSSANQRAGRAGRVSEGLCIRLYAEEDYDKRPRFTQPEIQRANLAEVILRMKAFRLGEVESFPFLNPPTDAAIRGGYELLVELGALAEEDHTLTPLGRELARLPVDPTLGRMLLQAREEGVLAEVLVIAAGQSIPDPRERPEEAKEAAATAHRAFAHAESDFLSLLNLWNAAPPVEGGPVRPSRNALRRFCKSNFLSLTRMREWRDIYRQLAEAMGGRIPRPVARPEEEHYRAIHRAIATGLLGHIAQRKERNRYLAGGNREVLLFPGSGLYARPTKKGEKTRQPEWIAAGEIVQTSQLFARTIARVEPEWIAELGAHLCRCRYLQPAWSARAGRVLVWERTLLHGLELLRKQVDFGKIAPAEANELFIRGALVAGEARISHPFFAANRQLRETMENALTRVRSGRVHDLDEAFYRFYAARLENLSSLHDLNRAIRARGGCAFLTATEADLVDAEALAFDRTAFPDEVALGNSVLPLAYRYQPGEEADGVTIRVPLPLAGSLPSGRLEWMIPGLRHEQAATLLRTLPKTLRKQLHPLEPKIAEIATGFDPGEEPLLPALGRFVEKRYGVAIPPEAWRPLPDYLRPRVEVVDRRNRAVATGRDLAALSKETAGKGGDSGAWARAARQWERASVAEWNFGDLPESIVVEEIGGAPLLAYPGLAVGKEGQVEVRLFRQPEARERATPEAIRLLAERALPRDLAWLHKELRTLGQPAAPSRKAAGASSLGDLLAAATPANAPATWGALPANTARHICTALLRLDPLLPLSKARFEELLQRAHREMPLFLRTVRETVERIFALRDALRTTPRRYPGLEEDLARLLPPDFPAHTPPARLGHLPRYLRAMQLRGERAAASSARDAEKARLLLPFSGWEKEVPPERQEAFRWLLEEYRVSLFAQELGTAEPVSPQRLRALGGLS